jgi:hypothetical protein
VALVSVPLAAIVGGVVAIIVALALEHRAERRHHDHL